MKKPWGKYFTEEARNFKFDVANAETIGQAINKAVADFGDKPALTTILPNGAETTITYKQFGEYSDYFAVYLREELKLQEGDVVALMSPNCIGFCVASAGIAKAGCISTNVNPLYTASELEHQLSNSKAKAFVIINLFGDKLDQVIANTNVKHVVTISLVDFFPALRKALIGFVLKRIRKVVPDIKTPNTSIVEALSKGAALAPNADIASYMKNTKPTDIAVYQYTSGTTGRSKGAELPHAGVMFNQKQAHLMTSQTMGPDGETVMVALPLYHITAFTLLYLAGIASRNHLILVPSPRPPSNLQKAFENHKITWFTGINTLYAALLVEPWFKKEMLAHIRFSGSGGAAQTTGVAEKWQELTGVRINQGYGMTEVCGVLTLNPPEENRFGKVGIPVPGAEVRIVDDNGKDVKQGEAGEVIAKTPTMMKGYLDNPEATAEALKDGWYYSGDIGVMDKDGFLEIVDRKKDMILVSGFNVSPNEIEDVISAMPGVVQVGVIGIEDEKTAEAPAAFIVREDESVTEETVLAVCKAGLTNYKTPRLIKFVDEVPVTLSGKVLRRELRDKYEAEK